MLFFSYIFQRKKFEIRAVDQPDKLTLYSGCDDKSKLLLGLCRDTHQFSMAIAPRLSEARRREEEGTFLSLYITIDSFSVIIFFFYIHLNHDSIIFYAERKVLRDCYMYPARCKLSLAARGARGDQRISVISSTSSNTTSGIVSDRVHSEDEPDTAPASTECLPRLTEYPNHSQAQPVLNGSKGDEHSRPSSPASTVDGENKFSPNLIIIFIIILIM